MNLWNETKTLPISKVQFYFAYKKEVQALQIELKQSLCLVNLVNEQYPALFYNWRLGFW